jgi:hypothetical protein
MVYFNFYEHFYNWKKNLSLAFKALWHFRPSRFYLSFFVILQGIAWWQAIYIFRHLSGNILVLHYNVNFGIDLVGNPSQIFFYPLYGLGIFLINLIIAMLSHRRFDFHTFVHLLLATALLFALFLNLALMFIYLINFK